MKDLTIIFFGTPSFVIPILETLTEHFTVLAVVTTPDERVGRNKILTPPPVKVSAESQHIPVFQPTSLRHDSLLSDLPNADVFVVASYGKLIPKHLLDMPKYGALNIHPSALPKYRGPSPIQTALLNGETETEVAIIKMDTELDHGPILQRQYLPIDKTDTFESLVKKAFIAGAAMLPATILAWVQEAATPVEQDHTNATYTKHFKREDGYFASEHLPEEKELDRMIRAFYPWPTAWTRLNGKIVKFLPNQKIQMEGKNPVSKKDFLNGYPQYKELIEKVLR